MADWKQKGIRQGKESVEKGRYSIFCIADWFLSKEPMPYDKVQGLCYYAQAWCYTLKGYKLTDTDFLAWPCGTVAPALYERFWYLGYEDITVPEKGNLDVEPEDISLLEDIWVTYGDRTGNALATLTCREFPWIEARVRYTEEEPFAAVISPESMKTYYKSIYIGSVIKVKKIASDNDAHFELCFKYPLMRGYTLKELSRQNNKELQNFLDKVSHMTIQQVDTLYGRKPDRTDFYGGEKVYHYAVADAFRIHVVREDGYYKIIRLDPNHKVHKS